MDGMQRTRWIERADVVGDWAMWVEVGTGTHAVLMDNEGGPSVWVETDSANASQYGRQFGWHRVARITQPGTFDVWVRSGNRHEVVMASTPESAWALVNGDATGHRFESAPAGATTVRGASGVQVGSVRPVAHDH